ncbi:Regulation of nuclear pre-mRNA domain-containing protein 1B, partial [Ophiophagus hannah]
MSSFSESALERKLSELSNSQQSVQTLSLWLIHHRKHAGPIVVVWHRELRKVKCIAAHLARGKLLWACISASLEALARPSSTMRFGCFATLPCRARAELLRLNGVLLNSQSQWAPAAPSLQRSLFSSRLLGRPEEQPPSPRLVNLLGRL